MADAVAQRDGCALVTGASRGIGAAIARALARDGWPTGVNYRSDRDGAEAVVGEIERDGGRAVALGGDVADPGAPDELFDSLESHFSRPVLVLVNNAGINRDDLLAALDDDEWSAVLETNLTAAFRLTRRASFGVLGLSGCCDPILHRAFGILLQERAPDGLLQSMALEAIWVVST